VKLADVIARVQRQVGISGLASDADVQTIARATVRELGLEVAKDGEVYNPAPVPAPNWEFPAQRNVRFRGGRRR